MKAYLEVLRPVNLIITAVSAMAAYLMAQGSDYSSFSFISMILIMTATTITAGAGNLVNDIYDIDIDRINKPNRPIPSGKISIKSAWFYYFTLTGISVLSSFFLGTESFISVVIVNTILYLYAVKLKRSPLWGNFIVAFISGYLFYFASITTKAKHLIIPLGLCAFLFHFIREIIKDIADYEGDKKDGASTFVIKYGIKNGLYIVRLLTSLLALYLFYLISFYDYNISFTLVVSVFVLPVLFYVFYKANRAESDQKYYEKLSKILKLDMIFGVLSFYLGLL